MEPQKESLQALQAVTENPLRNLSAAVRGGHRDKFIAILPGASDVLDSDCSLEQLVARIDLREDAESVLFIPNGAPAPDTIAALIKGR